MWHFGRMYFICHVMCVRAHLSAAFPGITFMIWCSRMRGGGKGCRGKGEQGEGKGGAGGRGQLVSRYAPSAADVPFFFWPSLSPCP
jgi:hypothetical protein